MDLRWYKTRLEVPANLLGGKAVFRLDGTGLGKGMIWVNGRAVGRYWLIEAKSPPWMAASQNPTPTLSQQYYHIPADWLRPVNEIVILEEQAATPATVELQARS